MIVSYYNISDDYESLYNLVQKGNEILGYLIEDGVQKLCKIRRSNMYKNDREMCIVCIVSGIVYFAVTGAEKRWLESELECFSRLCKDHFIQWIKRGDEDDVKKTN